jgi:outer membrane scaffolding protein for murein synthesis (MipA/OmpV family)
VERCKNELSLTATWMPLHFDPDDNDDHQMKNLDERKASAFLVGHTIATKAGEPEIRRFW